MSCFELDPDHVLRLLSWRSCIIEPLRQEGYIGEEVTLPDGRTARLHAADPYDRHTPYVLARILYTHPACAYVEPGMVVVMAPHAFERQWHNCELTDERYEFYIMHEENARAAIEGYSPELAETRDATSPRRGTDGNDTDVSQLAVQSA